MKNRLIVFTTDRDFVVPTMSAALQIAEQSRITTIADIIVYLIDIPTDEAKDLQRSFGDRFMFEQISAERFVPPEGIVFNKTHVPMATLARLTLSDLLPEQYEHIIYLDGDIYIQGDIYPLIAHDVEEDKVLAACDGVWLFKKQLGRRWSDAREYLDGLGIAEPEDYFNAGVLAFRRSSWKNISHKAMRYYIEKSANCRFHDQSALNAVCVGQREILSPVYNFTSHYAGLGAADEYDARIIHFTGGLKPWFYDGPPWNGRFASAYRTVLERHPVLQQFNPAQRKVTVSEVRRASWKSRRNALLTPWRSFSQRKMLKRYFQETQLAF